MTSVSFSQPENTSSSKATGKLEPIDLEFLCFFLFVWALSQVPLGKVPRGLGLVPRGLDQAPWPDRASWHTANQPKL
ncbi:hypothetical protein VP01_10868g1 [Puccinia sorghi]|uniref:Uncharacterized protein n=1 Tax=Puccinia sorghi TaxID=27349 RepID=A0A0L6VTH2_9BASI|nr:hypothetical protein VP01_10868g1 [Puccinia sorghi]